MTNTMKRKKITVNIRVERDGDGFYAYAPALKGLHMDGATKEEVLENVKAGIELYLDCMSDNGEPFPEGSDLTITECSDKATSEDYMIQVREQ